MKAALEALGYDSNRLEILLGQLVNVIENGEAVRMGKRKKMVTLDELMEEVGVDGTRYWMLMRSIDTTLDFDVELAKTKSDQNPVFYVQYAHARCCSILRKAAETGIDIESKKELPPYFEKAELEELLKTGCVDSVFSGEEKSDSSIKQLILKLEEFKTLIEAASRLRAPYMVCKYIQELASDLHHFYNYTRVLTDDKQKSAKMLLVVQAVKTVISSAFKLIRVNAPEKM